jgi:hypothetical protein
MTIFSFKDLLRHLNGGDKKVKPAFKSEKEAYDFARNLYRRTGGVTPELRKAYEFYQKNLDDGSDEFSGFEGNKRQAAQR